MALEWLDSFGTLKDRALESLTRFRSARPPELRRVTLRRPDGELIGATEFLDVNAWERAKAAMTPAESDRWAKMNAAEARHMERVCDTCGGRRADCKCDFE